MTFEETIIDMIPEEHREYARATLEYFKALDVEITFNIKKKDGKLAMSGWSHGEVPLETLGKYATVLAQMVKKECCPEKEV